MLRVLCLGLPKPPWLTCHTLTEAADPLFARCKAPLHSRAQNLLEKMSSPVAGAGFQPTFLPPVPFVQPQAYRPAFSLIAVSAADAGQLLLHPHHTGLHQVTPLLTVNTGMRLPSPRGETRSDLPSLPTPTTHTLTPAV